MSEKSNLKVKNSIVVSKFGGTSMGDANAMLQSADVTLNQKSNIVLVSATSGTTNELIALAQTAERGLDFRPQYERLLNKHHKIASELKISNLDLINNLFSELEVVIQGISMLKDCSAKALDKVVSYGERISSILFTHALQTKAHSKVELFDIRKVLKTDEQFGKARPILDEIRKNAKHYFELSPHKVYVSQGYIGETLDGFTTTLGRGGSDYSAALIAEAVEADILEIWTDVAGIATTDPRICKNAKQIPEITFQEASEMATFGAKILHPATLLPAIRKNIPVYVANTFAPQDGGTWVKKQITDTPLVRALAVRKKQSLLTLSTPEMLYAHGFLYKIFKVFNDHKVSIDAITTSEISVSLTLDDSAVINKRLIEDLSQFAEVSVEEGYAIVSLIGNKINHTSGLAGRIFSKISDINVRMICLGASKHNFCFLVQESQSEDAIKKLHAEFIE